MEKSNKEVALEYSNGEVTVVWKPYVCMHAKYCWQELPVVFNPNTRPWINMVGTSTKQIIQQVERCPSGALSYFYNNPQKEMEIIHEDNEGKGAFRAIEGHVQMGEMTYIWRGENKILIFHTGVEPEFEGQGIAKKLLMEAVNFVRKNDMKIIPLCPFVKAMYKKMPEIRDTLAE